MKTEVLTRVVSGMDAIIDSGRVADRLDEIRVVDVRDAWEYDGIGHLPGAVNVPFDSFRSEETGEEGMLPGAEVFEELLSEVGIENDDTIVAYDDMHGVFAARFLVTCELYGHPREQLHLLNGDYSSWSREQEVSRSSPEVSSTTYEAAFIEDGPLIGQTEVEAAMDDSDTVLVDTREEWEFEEGHIPGAIQLDWLELVDQDERGLKPESEIRSLLEERGITSDKRIVLYCNTARRISHTYTVLRHLGYENLAFYEGSLTEWEREGGPLTT
jgi:thiosulfate/3-mercaptopyruvate sulfurtransferase